MPYEGVESVVHGPSSACLDAIFKVHFPDASIVADVTFGKGRFWKWDHSLQVVGLDAEITGGAQVQSDYRFVPLKDASVDVAIFDPPFLFTSGLRGLVGAKRFFLGPKDAEQRFYSGADRSDLRIQAPRNPADLLHHTAIVAYEMRRIARRGMVFKGQDLIADGPNWWAYQVMRTLDDQMGLLPEDMLIQVSKAPRLHDPRWKRQYHFRRRHALYLIYKW